jgi:hypothetical protein
MRLSKPAAAAFVLLGSNVFASDSKKQIRADLLTDSYIPLVIIGEGWSQQIAVQNVDEDESVTGTLKFVTAQGEPWRVELIGRGTADTFFVALLPGQMAVYETAVRFTPQNLGYAYIDTNCCPYNMIQTVFRRQEANRPDLMTSLPIGENSLRAVHLIFDNRGGKFAGVGILTKALCFSFSCETVMDLVFRDVEGKVILEARRTQRNRTLSWLNLTAEYPQVGGLLGSLEIKSGNPQSEFLTAVGFSLQFAPNGAFTAVTTAER